MKKLATKTALLSAGGVIALSALAVTVAFAGGDDAETEVALPAPTIIRAINAAVAAKPGDIKGVEAESEGGVTKVEVEIVAADGKEYEVSVDAKTGKVLEVESEAEDKDDAGETNEGNNEGNDKDAE